uniref:Uncharacterized protein n=1 Tax=Arundo donax TaxID=35708 RepID=A0A0A9FMG2_ARUDO
MNKKASWTALRPQTALFNCQVHWSNFCSFPFDPMF